MGSFSIWHWLIVLVIVMLVFGTKKLKNIGSDLGGAVKGFKDGVRDSSTPEQAAQPVAPAAPAQQVSAAGSAEVKTDGKTIDVEVKTKS